MIDTKIRNGYAGIRLEDGVEVVKIVNGRQSPLPHLVHHSLSGFEWGYGGNGPADLARSIVGDVLGTTTPDPAIYQAFKWDFVAKWGSQWEISLEEVKNWLKGRMNQER